TADDQIESAGPGSLRVRHGGARRVVRVAVVVPDDLQAAVVALTLDAHLVARMHQVPVARALPEVVESRKSLPYEAQQRGIACAFLVLHDVAHPPRFADHAGAVGADQDAADLVR